jgi:hypothetical protein
MEPEKVARKVLKKTIQGFSQKALMGENGVEVRHLAFAKDTPPRYATRPTLWASRAYGIPGVDARIIILEGGVKH